MNGFLSVLGKMDRLPSFVTETETETKTETKSKTKTKTKTKITTHKPPEGLPGCKQCCLGSHTGII